MKTKKKKFNKVIISTRGMTQVVCLEGTFGSLKSTKLIEQVLAWLNSGKSVLIVAPTENHLRNLQSKMKHQCSGNYTQFENLKWQTAPVLMLGSPQTAQALINSMDAVAIDDADYPIGYKWNMPQVVKFVYTLRRPLLFLTCRHTATLVNKLSIVVCQENSSTLSRSVRLENTQHVGFMRALFTPKAKQLGRLRANELPTLVPRQTLAEMASAALDAVKTVHTVILCENEEFIQMVFKMAPAWNTSRKQSIIPVVWLPTNSNKYFDPCCLQLSTISNFFGRDQRHVVAVFCDHQGALNLFVEALTRHTVSLTVVFAATAPPPPLQNVLWMTETARENNIFIDGAPKRFRATEKEEEKTVGGLAKSIVDNTRDVEAALVKVQTLRGKTCEIICTYDTVPNYKTYNGLPLPDGIDRALGSVVEAVVLEAIGAQLVTESDVYRKTPVCDAELEYCASIDEQYWRLTRQAANNAGQFVDFPDNFFSWNREQNYEYFHDIKNNISRNSLFRHLRDIQAQVPLVFKSADGDEYRGVADAIGHVADSGRFILEIKHSMKHARVTDYAVIQATLYALAAGAASACVFNAASGHLAYITITNV